MRKLFLSIIALTLGTEHPGPAVKVTKGDTEVILYLPDKVEYIIKNWECGIRNYELQLSTANCQLTTGSQIFRWLFLQT